MSPTAASISSRICDLDLSDLDGLDYLSDLKSLYLAYLCAIDLMDHDGDAVWSASRTQIYQIGFANSIPKYIVIYERWSV